MGFNERYSRALDASGPRDVAHQRTTDALLATALAAAGVDGDLGALLQRVRTIDDARRDPASLAQLLRLWTADVARRGRACRWAPENTAWNAQAAHTLYRTVAELSLAHWLDGACKVCGGTGQCNARDCADCGGSGQQPIRHAGGFVRERVRDMVSELHCIAARHARRANARLHGRRRG